MSCPDDWLENPGADKIDGRSDEPYSWSIPGDYEITLIFTPQNRIDKEAEPDLSAISIFSALPEQLGLRLESQKHLIEVFVIDHIGKPSGN